MAQSTASINMPPLLLSSFLALYTPYCLKVGVGCAVAQCVFYLLFRSLSTTDKQTKDGVVSVSTTKLAARTHPGFTAHQVVCFPLMVYLTLYGAYMWRQNQMQLPNTSSAQELAKHRLFLDTTETRHLNELVLGMMTFWDLPTGLLTKDMREPVVLVHHFGMLLTAAIALGWLSTTSISGQTIPGQSPRAMMAFYGPFYFGLIEASSIPLVIVDLFHPKRNEWYRYLTTTEPESKRIMLQRLNATCRLLFALAFLGLRTIWFPFVSLLGVLPDAMVLHKAATEREEADELPLGLYLLSGFNVLFSFLQLYWGGLIVRQILKVIKGGSKKTKKKD